MAKTKKNARPTVSVPIFTSDGEGAYYPIDEENQRADVDAESLASSFVYMVTSLSEFNRGYSEGYDFEEDLKDLGIFVDPEDLEDED